MPVPFDTLAYARRLKAAGFSDAQAEGQADALAAVMSETFATKSDLEELGRALRVDIAGLRAEFVELRGEFADLRGEFAEVRGEFAELRGEFAELKGEFAEQRGELATLRAEFGTLSGSVGQMENRIVVKLGGMMAVGFAVLATLVKIL